MAEMLVESYSEYFKCIILRLFTVYGPGQTDMLIPSLIRKVKENRPIQVQGKKGFVLSPIFIDDAVEVISSFVDDPPGNLKNDTYNVGGDEAIGIYDLGLLIGKLLKITPQFEIIHGADPGGWIANNSKLKSRLILKPFVNIEDGLAKVVKYESNDLSFR
jgi:nucleoside-diphosphate-sugar epimerase